jgi:hypothetical protein
MPCFLVFLQKQTVITFNCEEQHAELLTGFRKIVGKLQEGKR